MAKTTGCSKAKDIRANRIANCQQCLGNPKVDETNLQGRLVRFCETCLEVINWQEEGKVITSGDNKKLVEDSKKIQDIHNKIIKGNIVNFDELKIN